MIQACSQLSGANRIVSMWVYLWDVGLSTFQMFTAFFCRVGRGMFERVFGPLGEI